MSIIGIFLGLLMILGGVFALKYNYQLTNNFGSFGFLNRILGPGNEYASFKIMALLLIFAGFVTMFGIADNLLNFLFTPLRNLFNPPI